MYNTDNSKYNRKKLLLNSLNFSQDFIDSNKEEIQISNKKIGYNILSSLYEVLEKTSSTKNNNNIKKYLEFSLYGSELAEFKKYDLNDRKKILEYKYSDDVGILKLGKKINLSREFSKKGIEFDQIETKLSNLESKLEEIDSIKETILDVRINENVYDYLNSFLDLYKLVSKKLKNKNSNYMGIDNIKEGRKVLYQSQMLAYLRGKSEVTAKDTLDIIKNYNPKKFKYIKKEDFFDKVQEYYIKIVNKNAKDLDTNFQTKAEKIKEDYLENKKNNQAFKLKYIVEKEEIKKYPKDKISETKKMYDPKIIIIEHNLKKVDFKYKEIKDNYLDKNKRDKEKDQAYKLREIIQESECEMNDDKSLYKKEKKLKNNRAIIEKCLKTGHITYKPVNNI